AKRVDFRLVTSAQITSFFWVRKTTSSTDRKISMKSGNPVLRDSTFTDAQPGRGVMTLDGVVNKTGILILLCMVSFCFAWYQPAPAMPLILAGCLGGFLVGIVTCFKPRIAPYTSPVYALLEG